MTEGWGDSGSKTTTDSKTAIKKGWAGSTTSPKKKSTAFSSKSASKKLQNAVASGDVIKVRRIANDLGLGDQDRKGLIAVTKKFSGGSFLNRLTDDISATMAGLPKGLASMVGSGVAELNATARGRGNPLGGLIGGVISGEEDRDSPFSSSIGASFHRTGKRISNPKQLASDYSQHPFQSLIEDAGNVAIVGGLGAKAAGRAGLVKTASSLEKVAEVNNAVANSPFLPVSRTARAANKIIKGISTKAGQTQAGRNFMDLTNTSPDAQLLKPVLRRGEEAKGVAANEAVRGYRPASKLLHGAEQEAMFIVGQQMASGLVEARRLLPADDFTRMITETPYLRDFSPDAVNLAVDVIEGKNPKLAAKINEALEVSRPTRVLREERELAAGMSPEQTGSAPLSEPMAKALEPLQVRLRKVQEAAVKARRKADATSDAAAIQGEAKAVQRAIKREAVFEEKAIRDEMRTIAKTIRKENQDRAVAFTEAKNTLRHAEKEYRARAEQLALALRAGGYQGLTKLRADTMAAYQRYSDAITARETLRVEGEQAMPPQQVPRVDNPPPTLDPRREAARLPIAGRASVYERVARLGERQAGNAAAKLRAAEINLATDINMAPARWRPVVTVYRAAAKELTGYENQLRKAGLNQAAADIGIVADEIPTMVASLEAAGINPEHFINPGEKALGPGGGPDLTLPRPKKRLSSQRFRSGKGAHDMTLPAQAKAEASRAAEHIERATAAEVARLPFVKRAGDITEGLLGDLPTRVELNKMGLETWSPTGLFQTTDQISANTLVMPKPLFDSFKDYYSSGRIDQIFKKYYDPVTQTFKVIVLPLSVAWNTGNAVTNAVMATLVAGETPWTLVRGLREAIDIHKKTGLWGPDRLYGSGSTFETLDFLGQSPRLQGRVGRKIMAVPKAGYAVNQFIDNISRSAVYYAKKAKGYSDEVAMKMSLNALGDFTKLTPLERKFVRRVIPFYTWIRHMSQVAVRLPIEHPMRTAWVLHMGNTFKDQEQWEEMLPSFMQGYIDAGGDNTIGLQNFMPFSSPLTGPKELLGNIAPQLKIPFEQLTGYNTFTRQPFTRPPGTGNEGPFGKLLPTSPPLLEQLRKISPQMRTIDALRGRKDVARYESGDPILIRNPETGKRESIKTPQSDLRTILGFAGIKVGSEKELKNISASILARRVANWKAAHPTKKIKTSSSRPSGAQWGG